MAFFSAVHVGIIVGVTVSAIFLLLIIGIPICIGVTVCYTSSRRRYQPLQTHVVATTGATVATSNQPAMANPVVNVHSQQPNTRLISHEAPPSYAATTATAYPFQQPPQVISSLHGVMTSII